MKSKETVHSLLQSCSAGFLYFTGVFALAFVFGLIRRMVVVQWLGELVAVSVEVPILLGFCWVFSRRLIVRMEIPPRRAERLVLGLTAFTLLMMAEFLLSVLVFANSFAEYVTNFYSLPGLVGLAGQIVFALIPWLQLFTESATFHDSAGSS